MIYIIDHQDSFTWNVVHQFSKFDSNTIVKGKDNMDGHVFGLPIMKKSNKLDLSNCDLTALSSLRLVLGRPVEEDESSKQPASPLTPS